MNENTNAQIDILREFAAELDHYAGTVLNASSAADMARAWADNLSRGIG